jgi:L-idonate 5-dehydrogenase
VSASTGDEPDTYFGSLVVTGPGQHVFVRTRRGALPADHVRVRVSAVAFCGTDFKLLRGELHDASYPVVPGHEWSGHVIEAESDPGLVGAHVVASIYEPCGECRWCASEEAQHCVALDEHGFTLPGGCAEEIVVPRRNVRLVPPGVGPTEACLFEPLTVAIHAIDRTPDLADCNVVVFGAGAVGLLLLQLVRAGGGHCTVVEPSVGRRALADELGAIATVASAALLPASAFEVVLDATGSPGSFIEGISLLEPLGTLVLVGYSGDSSQMFAPSSLMLKELTVHGVLSGVGTLDRAIDLVAAGVVRLDLLVAAPMPIVDYAELLGGGPALAPRQPMTFAP